MTRAVLSIGSNVGDSLGHLRSVTAALGRHVIAASSVYATAPWGGVEQQDFLNAVLVADDPERGPRDWLVFAGECEVAAERVRVQRWGPRSLDVDIIECEDTNGHVVSKDPELLLPHPRAFQRAFVLVPWLEVEPDAVLAVDDDSRPVSEWLAALEDTERSSVRRTDMTLDTTQ